MDALVTNRIKEWTSPPYDGETIREINDIQKRGDEKELTDRFHTMLEFGTGGLRGVIGAGTNRMNTYTVGMATQGLVNYIIRKGKQKAGVVIARDSRRMSDAFAREAASILAGNGIAVYFYDDIMPTPLCSFAIRKLKAGSGIVITASHNPPEYNGYKVYWDDGGQVVPPIDDEIIEEVKKINAISSIKKTGFDEGISSGMIRLIGDEIIGAYKAELEKSALRPAAKSPVKIVYTPLHGTGYKIVPEILKHFGFENIHLVERQTIPDGAFPTVKSPNPEERDALALSIELAGKVDADLVLATDPDADRMGVGFKDENGNYVLINGNQIGTMLEFYLLSRLSKENRLPADAAVVKTIVTTDLQEKIARSFRCSIDDVLTGFKWIALKMKEYEHSGSRRFIFGGEESYGYLPVDFVRDKDAVSSCYFFAEMTDWLMQHGDTLNNFLNTIYRTYGLYLEDLLSITMKGIDGMEKIASIMKAFRTHPPRDFSGVAVEKMSDIQALEITDCRSGSREAIKDLPKSDVLQFFMADGSKITMRPSGTEPKIKFYFSVNEMPDAENFESTRVKLQNKLEGFKKDLNSKIAEIR